jgi:hypothetical protein
MEALAAAAAVVESDEDGYAPDNMEHRAAPVDADADEARLAPNETMDLDKENIDGHAAASAVGDAVRKVITDPRMTRDTPRA